MGALFADTNLPLRLWFEAMRDVTNQKYGPARWASNGSWNWLHKLRRAMVRPGRDRDRLGGVVEADEIYRWPRSGKRGRGVSGKSLLEVLVQETPRQASGGIR